MKGRFATIVIVALCLGYALSGLGRQKKTDGRVDTREISKLPVLLNGRLKPLDSVARNSLVVIYGKQTFKWEDEEEEKRRLSAMDWLLELLYDAPAAAERAVFTIHNPDVLALLGKKESDGKHYSYTTLEPYLHEIDRQAQLADQIEAQLRTPFQRHVMKLQRQAWLYGRLQHSVQLPGNTDTWASVNGFLKHYADRESSDLPQAEADQLARGFFAQTEHSHFFPIPPARRNRGPDEWRKLGQAVLQAVDEGALPPAVMAWSKLGDAFRRGDSKALNEAVVEYLGWLETNEAATFRKTQYETRFNHLAPFYRATVLYVVVFLAACWFWLTGSPFARKLGMTVLFFTLALHTFGLLSRMLIEGRPPVTNLYSSAVFVGFGAVVLGAILEAIYRNGIGSATAAINGFLTLVIAHHLSLGGDTMEMMRAVLDSNFWLATHVVVITLGYSATFLAGGLALIYVLRKFIFGQLEASTGKALTGMIYGIVCFATLFSFVGTILGGIWADQSWGRFWGWDPKENGALLIVIWNAVILHARWGGMIRERGLVVMAIFGNIVTAWSWFGTNMLGIGLHSYGFTDAAFLWLVIFVGSQLIFMVIGAKGREWNADSPPFEPDAA